MKSWSRIGIVFTLVLSIAIAAVPGKVSAKAIIFNQILLQARGHGQLAQLAVRFCQTH